MKALENIPLCVFEANLDGLLNRKVKSVPLTRTKMTRKVKAQQNLSSI